MIRPTMRRAKSTGSRAAPTMRRTTSDGGNSRRPVKKLVVSMKKSACRCLAFGYEGLPNWLRRENGTTCGFL